MVTCRPSGNLLRQTSGSMMMIKLKSEFVVDTALHSARTRASIGVDICVLLGPSDLLYCDPHFCEAKFGASSKFAMEKSAKRIAGSWHLQCSRHGKLRCRRRRRCRRGRRGGSTSSSPPSARRSISVSRAVIIIASVKLNCLRGRGANELWRQLAWWRGHTGFAPEYPRCMLLF